MCDCIGTINTDLRKQHNTIVSSTFGRPSRAVVSTLKFDPKARGKPVALIATYCPFCGEKYADAALDQYPFITDDTQLKKGNTK